MEQHFIPIIATPVGISTLKKTREENTANTKCKTAPDLAYQEKVCAMPDKSNIEKIKKTLRRVNKPPRSINPQVLFNILRALLVGESYLIQ